MIMIKFVLFIVSIGAVAAAASENIRFTDCAHHEISTMQFSGCTSEESECKVVKGSVQTFNVQFVANQDTATVKIEMLANVGGLEIPVPGLKTDACDGDVKCPLVKGEKYNFTYSLNLPQLIPNVHATVIAKLTGQHGLLACAKMAGQVV